MLGRAIVEQLAAAGHTTITAGRGSQDDGSIIVDLSQQASIQQIAAVDMVINCAAYTDVDGAEGDEASAMQANGEGVGWLAERCAAIGAKLVHFSSDYVFDGEGDRPYATDHPIAPINAYGRSKADGEQRIRDSHCHHLIVRTSWLYAPWGKNFVRTMARLGRERDRLRVVDDQHGRPTNVQYLAQGTLQLVDADASGTMHLSDSGQASWFELASHVVARINPSCRVEPCSSSEFPRPAPRPRYSVLDLTTSEALIGTPRPWREAVDDVIGRLT